MTPESNNTAGVEERTELLINRRIDGEVTAEEQVELDAILAVSPAACAMLADYRGMDALAGQALRADFEAARTAVVVRRYRGWWLAAAGGILAAAAVVGLSVLTNLPAPTLPRGGGQRAPVVAPAIQPQFIDYSDTDFRPRNRRTDLHRDLIGVRGPNENVIYILERARQATRVRPIAGDI